MIQQKENPTSPSVLLEMSHTWNHVDRDSWSADQV